MSRQHEHRWEPPNKEDALVFEDGAAIFHEVCRWQPQRSVGHSERLDETFYEPAGPECGEERRVRFDAVYIKRADRRFFPIPSDRSDVPEETERIWETVESGLSDDGDTEVVEVDPDPDDGRVVVEHGDYRLVYAPDPEAECEMYHEKQRSGTGGGVLGP